MTAPESSRLAHAKNNHIERCELSNCPVCICITYSGPAAGRLPDEVVQAYGAFLISVERGGECSPPTRSTACST